MARTMVMVLCVAVLAGMSGCSFARVQSYYVYQDARGLPPTDPNAVKILPEFPADGSFIEVGEIVMDVPRTTAVLEGFKIRAAEMGGDAVVISARQEKQGRRYLLAPITKTAKVIKYGSAAEPQ